jgi:hypothetical protein
MSKYDTTLFNYFQNLKNQLKVSPLNLGGTATSSGGPPGGFTGYLPQNKVGYDVIEAQASGFSDPNAYNSSGVLVIASLVDNLNHIRYRIAAVEGLVAASGTLSIYDDDELVLSGVTVLNFTDDITAVETGPGEVTISVVATGISATDEKVKISSNDTTSDYIENKIIAVNLTSYVTPEGGDESFVIRDDEKSKVSSNDSASDYLQNKLTAGTNVTITVLNEGGVEELQINSTASGSSVGDFLDLTDTPDSYSGQTGKYIRVNSLENALEFSTASGSGSAITIKDDGSILTSEVTSIDFVGSNVTATASGSNVTVTISGAGIEGSFVGLKGYLDTNQQLSTSTGWQAITFTDMEYESDLDMWTNAAYSDDFIFFQENGYYSVIAQVTISGDIPDNERIQLGLFKGLGGTFIVGIYDGYYTSVAGCRTLQVLYQGNFTSSDNLDMKILNGEGTQPYVLSGVENTFLAVHKIHGMVQATESDPKISSVYLGAGNYISANNETETAITWTAEKFDTDTMWSSGSQVQINTAGYYHVDASCVWEDLNNHGNVPFQVKIGVRLNGTTMVAQKYEWHDVDTDGAHTDALSTPISCDTPYLDTDDYLEVVVWHSKGSTASNIIRPPDYNTYCMVHKIQ